MKKKDKIIMYLIAATFVGMAISTVTSQIRINSLKKEVAEIRKGNIGLYQMAKQHDKQLQEASKALNWTLPISQTILDEMKKTNTEIVYPSFNEVMNKEEGQAEKKK